MKTANQGRRVFVSITEMATEPVNIIRANHEGWKIAGMVFFYLESLFSPVRRTQFHQCKVRACYPTRNAILGVRCLYLLQYLKIMGAGKLWAWPTFNNYTDVFHTKQTQKPKRSYNKNKKTSMKIKWAMFTAFTLTIFARQPVTALEIALLTWAVFLRGQWKWPLQKTFYDRWCATYVGRMHACMGTFFLTSVYDRKTEFKCTGFLDHYFIKTSFLHKMIGLWAPVSLTKKLSFLSV